MHGNANLETLKLHLRDVVTDAGFNYEQVSECVMGHAEQLFGTECDPWESTARKLGLTDGQAYELFFNRPDDDPSKRLDTPERYTRLNCVATIDRFQRTGVVSFLSG